MSVFSILSMLYFNFVEATVNGPPICLPGTWWNIGKVKPSLKRQLPLWKISRGNPYYCSPKWRTCGLLGMIRIYVTTNQPCPIIIVLVCEMFFFHFFPRFLRLFFVHSSLFWLMILSTVVNFIWISFWIPQDWHMKTPTEMWTVLGNPTDFIEVPYLCWFTGG